MKKLTALFLFTWSFNLYSQEYDLELDFPEVPTSPAFVVMDVSPTEIESPATPSDLLFSVQNATGSFTSVPRNYFVSIAPYWMLNKTYVPQDKFLNGGGNNIVDNLLQTLQLSIGRSDSFRNETYDRRTGLGFNVSIIRGSVNKGIRDKYFTRLSNYNSEVQKLQLAAEKADPTIIDIDLQLSKTISRLDAINTIDQEKISDEEKQEKEALENELNKVLETRSARQGALYAQLDQEYLESLKKGLAEIQFIRTGFFLNLAGGMAWDQTDSTSNIYRSGLWVYSGYQMEKANWTFVGRILNHDEVTFKNEQDVLDRDNFTTVDIGIKLNYNIQAKASLSGEFIYRSVPNTEISSSYRSVINFSYAFSKDITINFTYGKDFDALINGNPQYLALVNLVAGIGQKRKLKF